MKVYLESAENCNMRSAIMASHMQVPAGQRKENAFIEGERKLGRLYQTKFPGLFIGWVLASEKQVFLLPVEFDCLYRAWEFPLLVSLLSLTERMPYSVIQSCLTPCDPLDLSPLFLGFFRQESWSGLPLPPPGDLPDSGIKLT